MEMRNTLGQTPLTEWQQQLITDYLSDGYKRVKQCIYVTMRRTLTYSEMEDYIEVAHEALCKAAKRYKEDKGMTFSSFANMTIQSSLKSQLTFENRLVRIINKIAESLDAPVDDTEKLFLKDIAIGCDDVEIYEVSERIIRYLRTLSQNEKDVLYLRWQGHSYSYITKEFGYTAKKMRKILISLQDHDKIKILKRSERL